MDEKKIQQIMASLKCSREEALQLLEDDKAIDRGQKMDFDLSKDQEKQAKKWAGTGTRKTTTTERKRKENPEKRALIGELANFLVDYGCKMIHCVNPERQISFEIGENQYELTLVQKRKAK